MTIPLSHPARPKPPEMEPIPMTRILIAEDEDRIVSFLEKGLRAGGYTPSP